VNENKLYKDDIQRFIEAQLPWKHHKNPHYDLKVWNRYCETINEVRKLDEIPASELNLLRTFILLEKTNDLRLWHVDNLLRSTQFHCCNI
jgi:hypothetical protein